MFDRIDFPAFRGGGQFAINIQSLVKKCRDALRHKGLGIDEKRLQGCERPRDNRIDRWQGGVRKSFQTNLMNKSLGAGPADGFPQKGNFLAIALVKMNLITPGNGHHQTRYSPARTQVGQHPSIGGKEGEQLHRVEDMARP